MELKKILIATGNPGKFAEIREVLCDLPMKFLSLSDVGLANDADESGESHEENALLKARHFYKKVRMPVLAEDSGIFVDALAGELGVHTRRWGAGERASDEEWISVFLERMKELPFKQRGARFVCHAALIIDGKEYLFDGECRGTITQNLEVPIREGLPLSSCFRPGGFGKVYAAIRPEEKAKISHRGKAICRVRDFILRKNDGVKIQEVLKELEKTQKESFWNMPADGAVFVNILTRLCEARNVLEIGTSNGVSALHIADALLDTGGKLYTVESHKKRFALANENFGRARVRDIVIQIRGHAPEAVIEFFQNKERPFFDLVLIDATKEESALYVTALMPFMKKGTVIVTDNIISHRKSFEKFLDFMNKNPKMKNTELAIGNGLLVSVVI